MADLTFETVISACFPHCEFHPVGSGFRLSPCPICGSSRRMPCVIYGDGTKIYCNDGGCALSDHPRSVYDFVRDFKLHAARVAEPTTTGHQEGRVGMTVLGEVAPPELLAQVARLFHENLLSNPRCDEALDYQLRARRHDRSTLVDFRVGYTGDISHLWDQLKETGSWSDEQLLATGIFHDNRRQKTAPRYTYPIVYRGQVRAIKFKALAQRPEDMDYFRPIEATRDYPLLLNFDRAVGEEIIICEGENDLLSLVEAGYENVIASLGRPRADSLSFLDPNKKYLSAFDHDEAGSNYARDLARRFRVAEFPYPEQFKDPDMWCRHLKR